MTKLNISDVPFGSIGIIWQDNSRARDTSRDDGFDAYFSTYSTNKEGKEIERNNAQAVVPSLLIHGYNTSLGLIQSFGMVGDKGKLSAAVRKQMTTTVATWRAWVESRKEFTVRLPNNLLGKKEPGESKVTVSAAEVLLCDNELRGSSLKDSQWKVRLHCGFRRVLFFIPIANAFARHLGRKDLVIRSLPIQHLEFVDEIAAFRHRMKENDDKTLGFRALKDVDDLANGLWVIEREGWMSESDLQRKLGLTKEQGAKGGRGRIQKVYPTLEHNRNYEDLGIVSNILSGNPLFSKVDKEVTRKLVIPDNPRNPKRGDTTWEKVTEEPYKGALSPANLMEQAGVEPTDISGISYSGKEFRSLLAARKPDVERYFTEVVFQKRDKAAPLGKTLKAVGDDKKLPQVVQDMAKAITSRKTEELEDLKPIQGALDAAYVAAQAGSYCLITPDGDGKPVPDHAVEAVLKAINTPAPSASKKAKKAKKTG